MNLKLSMFRTCALPYVVNIDFWQYKVEVVVFIS